MTHELRLQFGQRLQGPRLGVLITALLAILLMPAGAVVGAGNGTRLDWSSSASMPTARAEIGLAAAPNGKLYAVGGSSGAGPLTTVEEYDPAVNAWTTKAPMSTARSLVGLAVASNGKLYAVGGATAQGKALDTVEEYDPATNSWTTKAPMPTPRSGPGLAAAQNGKLYAVGGAGGQYLFIVEEYDPTTNTWASRASMTVPRSVLGLAAAPSGKLYAIGGFDASGYSKVVEEYDPTMNTWATRMPMPTGRGVLGVAAAANGRLYAVGGYNGAPVNTVEEYDPQANTWATRASLPRPLTDLGLTAAPNGKLYAVGGNSGGPDVAMVEEYDPATGVWTTPPALAPLTVARQGLATVALGGQVYAIGGSNTSGRTGALDLYDPASNSWSGRAVMPTARSLFGAAAGNDGLIYAIGGDVGGIPGVVRTVEGYNPATNSWATRASMPTLRYGLAAVRAGDGLIYAIGGAFTFNMLGTVEAYNPANDTWVGRASMPTARSGLAAVLATNGKIYAIGGTNGSTNVATVEEYDPTTDHWTGRQPMPTARDGLAAIAGADGHVYAIGGRVPGGINTCLNVVEEYDPQSNVWTTRAPMPTARCDFGTAPVDQHSAFAIGGVNGNGNLSAVERMVLDRLPQISAGGPYTVTPGAQISLNASGSDPDNDAVSYAWDLDDNLLYATAGQNAMFSAAGLAAGTVRTVRVRAVDPGGGFGVASTTVTVASAARLAFATQPGGAQPGARLNPQPVIQAHDANGTLVAGFNGPVTITRGANPGGGTLGGTTTVNAVNGVASFSDLSISVAGTGYTLVASSGALQSAASAPFAIISPVAPTTPTPVPSIPSVPAGPCAPRPRVGVQVVPVGGGRLRVSITSSTEPATPGNHLVNVQFGGVANAAVEDVSGQGPPASVPTGATIYDFVVRRTGPGGVSLPFTVTDTCGPWPSFAGGGPDAF